MMNYPPLKLCQFVSTNLGPLLLVCIIITIFKLPDQVDGFHLSFGHRLIKSATNPQLNPASTLIRPIECRNANNHTEVGICMFSIDCMQNKGVPLSVCKHNYFVGTCCRLPDYNNFVGIVYDLRDTEANQLLEARKGLLAPLGPPEHPPNLVASPLPPVSQAPEQSPPPPPPISSSSSAPSIQYSSTSTTSAGPPVSAAAATSGIKGRGGEEEEEEKIGARYIISSTSLFPMAPTRQPAVVGSLRGQEQQLFVADQKHSAAKGSINQAMPTAMAGESARNVDGVTQALLVSSNNPLGQHKQQIVIPSELDSYHLTTNQSAPSLSSSSLAPPSFDVVSSGPMNQVQNGGAYELIRDSTPAVVDKPSSDQPSTGSVMSSSVSSTNHQAAAQQQFNVIDHPEAVVEPGRPPVAPQQSTIDRQPQLQDSVYLLDDQQHHHQHHHQQQQHRNQQTIVFANNHQQLASSNQAAPTFKLTQSQPPPTSVQPTVSSTSSTTGSQQQSSESDQEFTLSSSTSSASSTTSGGLSSDQGGLSTLSLVSVAVPLTNQSSLVVPATRPDLSSKSSEDQQQQQQQQTTTLTVPQQSSTGHQASATVAAAMSTHVDLVSSNTVQTTTPFTSSLSTALLPNISSHPYAPTEEPPAISLSPLVPPNQTFSPPSQSLSSSSSSSSSTSPKQTLNTTTTTMSQGTQTTPSASSSSSQWPSPATLGQLYSNQHSGTGSGSGSGGIASTTASGSHDSYHNNELQWQQQHHHHQSAHINRPPLGNQGGLMGLHPATKIVTGGSSSANNLIPGLSGLQSAILSHIPFKIASGLSSGLSSYLQAAMKPTGSRPLISSNTAPSLQYQQQQAAAAAAAAAAAQMANTTTKLTQSTQQQQAANGAGGSLIIQGQASSIAPSVVALVPNSQTSGIRFPGAPSSLSSSSAPTTLEATGSSSTTNANSQVINMNDTFTSPRNSYDVIRDAQQVCGRPQVPPPSFSLENGGKKRVARIVGGNQSLFGQWPWMVSLRQWRKGAFLHKCGAALLNENWAITAAHCVENVKASDLLLRLGEFDVSNQEEPYPYVERRVKTVVAHPSFDPKTFEFDLALLRFAEPVKFERNIVPVCVPSGNDSYVDRMATVIGWGRLYEDGPLPDVIQHVDVPIITNNECEKMYKNAGYIEEIPEMFICAGISKGGRDSCEGDSGGPLTMVDHDGRSYLVGIISWGIGCALPSQPGVYTRITAFSGWINQITAF